MQCNACGEHVSRGNATRCECGAIVHASCEHFQEEFECENSRDRWIGAVEF